MDREHLQRLLVALRTGEQQAQAQVTFIHGQVAEAEEQLAQSEKQAYAQLGFAQGKIAQLEELLTMLDTVDKVEEDDSGDAAGD